MRSTSVELVDTMLALMPDAAVVVDATGAIVHSNEALAQLFGYELGALVGQQIEVLIPERLRAAHRGHREAFATSPHPRAMGAGLTLSGRRRDGSEFPVDISLAPLAIADEVATVASIRDVTDRKQSETELRRLLDEQVALALQLQQAREERDELLLGDERGRIARDLHDVVIQRLFASGLSIQSVLPLVRDERASQRLAEVVDELDTTIRQIRTTIFTLAPPSRSSSGLRTQVLELIDESGRSLGFEATAHFSGPLDTATGDAECAHVLAVIREALANIARHAHARSARIEVSASDSLQVVVTDDGVGTEVDRRESGLRNLRQRAEELGGSLVLTAGDPSGTVLTWQIPLTTG
jgi:two-component system sensor histidine kinase DevS